MFFKYVPRCTISGHTTEASDPFQDAVLQCAAYIGVSSHTKPDFKNWYHSVLSNAFIKALSKKPKQVPLPPLF